MAAQHELLLELSSLADAATLHKQQAFTSPITKACNLLSSDRAELSWRAAKQLKRMKAMLGNVCQRAAPNDNAALAAALPKLQPSLRVMLAALIREADMSALRSALNTLQVMLKESRSSLAKARMQHGSPCDAPSSEQPSRWMGLVCRMR